MGSERSSGAPEFWASFTSSRSFWIATCVRLCLIFQILIPPDLLRLSSEPAFESIIVHPTYTLYHVDEAVAIREIFGGSSSESAGYFYAARDRIHLPPILLEGLVSFSQLTGNDTVRRILFGLFLLIIDLSVANLLEKIARCRFENESPWEEHLQEQLPDSIKPPLSHIFPIRRVTSEPTMFQTYQIPSLIALVYYVSPVVMLSGSLYMCFQNLTFFFVLLPLGIACGSERSPLPLLSSQVVCGLFLAFATYVDLPSVVHVIPLVCIMKERNMSTHSFFLSFVCFFGYLLFRGYTKTRPHNYFEILWTTLFHTQDAFGGVQPSLSLSWYFSMEMFNRFEKFYQVLQLMFPYLALLPLSVRLKPFPMVLVAVFWLIWSIFGSTMTLYRINVALTLMLYSPRSLARLRKYTAVFLAVGILIPVFLYVATYDMWLTFVNGDPNFLFFQCFAFNIFVSVLLIEFTNASLKRAKALRLTEKLMKNK